jgi:molybdopterin molybdotransferase
MMTPSPENNDVRMRGFTHRSTVQDASAWIDQHSSSLPTVDLPVSQVAGRVLGREIVSGVNVPGFARSMMDGYAIRAEDSSGATPYNPLSLEVRGEILPGQAPTMSLEPGTAVRIMTGAPMPEGADSVIPAEQVQAGETEDQVQLLAEVSPGKHVGQPGEDITEGELVLPANRRLRPQDIGLLSSIGVGRVPVIATPRVQIVVTGDELLPAGSPPRGYQVTDANSPMLSALVRRDGGEPLFGGIIADQPEAIAAALGEPADLVLVSGGSSVGLEDHAPRILAKLGELSIHGIAIRPSSPTGMGLLDGKLVFLLPGNPVSCLCAYDFFAGRAIRQLAGLPVDFPYPTRRLPLSRKLVSVIGRVDYARVAIQGETVEPLAISGASILSSTTRADGFVVIDQESEGMPAGAEVDVFLYQL